MLGKVVRDRRKKLGWKQQLLADKAELAQSYVSMIENGVVTDVSMETLRRLARVLEIPIGDLLEAAGADHIAPEDFDSQFLRDIAAVEHLLTPEHQAALLETARVLARQDAQKRAQRHQTAPPPTDPQQGDERDQGGSNGRWSA